MGHDALLALAREALLLMVLASLPPIGASLVVGFLMGLVQAATSIQEQALSVVPKLCAAVLALVIAAPWIAGQLSRFTAQLLLAIGQVSL
ncbi:MAG TPA: flagellar biosynthetic protein FliQ [Myxococcaceae bacterium]|jgi:flagellar biosynthetic protein FliQ